MARHAVLLLVPAALSAACSDPLRGIERTYATACRLAAAPASPPRIKLTPYLSRATLRSPVQMLPANDGGRRVFIVEQGGTIQVADDATPDGTASEWLNITGRVTSGGEMGLLSLAFDPRFPQNGRIYVNYTTDRAGRLQTRVSRFRVPDPARGRPDPQSEQILLVINQPYGNHNGGQIAFGRDGYLYVGMGDGGSGGDPVNAGQRMDTLLGKFLRIDVSTDDASYRIPPDNPFYTGQPRADGTGANNSHCRDGQRPGTCGETWALGLRNPWRFSFDVDGTLWTGDVGQGAREEIDVIERGKNYGWRCMEGNEIHNDEPSCREKRLAKAFTGPVHDYPRSDGKSVTGGHVYRGKAVPGLLGAYLFADYVDGTVWALAQDQGGAWRRTTLADQVGNVSAFGLDADGEMYVVEYGGKLLRIEAASPGEKGQPGWPERLSETGCFADLAARKLTPGAIAYSVNAPLWSDGAEKERALVLPEGGMMTYTEEGTWLLPEGTVLIKTFLLRDRPLETRFLVWEGGKVRGATYRWNDERTEAFLMSAGLETRVGESDWVFPSRAECLGCHTAAAGGVLGLTTAQMNRAHDMFGTGRVSQIDALARIGYLNGVPGPAEGLPRYPDLSASSGVDVAQGARVYLDANCSHCHRPGGLSNATIDLRAGLALRDTKACDVPAQMGDLGVPGARVIAPGRPDESALLLRMTTRQRTTRMPNIGSLVPDAEGAALVRRWIAGLGGCE